MKITIQFVTQIQIQNLALESSSRLKPSHFSQMEILRPRIPSKVFASSSRPGYDLLPASQLLVEFAGKSWREPIGSLCISQGVRSIAANHNVGMLSCAAPLLAAITVASKALWRSRDQNARRGNGVVWAEVTFSSLQIWSIFSLKKVEFQTDAHPKWFINIHWKIFRPKMYEVSSSFCMGCLRSWAVSV